MNGARAIVPLFCFIAVNAGWSIVASRYDYLVLSRNSSCTSALSHAVALGSLATRECVLRPQPLVSKSQTKVVIFTNRRIKKKLTKYTRFIVLPET